MFKRVVKVFIFLSVIFILLEGVQASFVCGKVNSNGLNVNWINVKAAYTNRLDKITTCQISPEEKKYCCDLLATGESWAKGKNVSVWIDENKGNLFAEAVKSSVSGQGYDLAPALELREAISFDAPIKRIVNYSTNGANGAINFNLSISYPYNNLRYDLFKNQNFYSSRVVCNNCTRVNFRIDNLTHAEYRIVFYASSSNKEISLEKNFSVINYLNLSRKYACSNCSKPGQLTHGDIIDFKVYLNSSDKISGEFYEYLPKNFIILSNQTTGNLNSDYNYIVWEINGKDIELNYSVFVPSSIMPRSYRLYSSIEGVLVNLESLTVKSKIILWLLPIPYPLFPSDEIFNSDSKADKEFFSTTGPSNPIYFIFNNSAIDSVTVFTSESQNDRFLLVKRINSISISGSEEFRLESNLQNLTRVNFYANLNLSEKNNIRVLHKEDGIWKLLTNKSIRRDGNIALLEYSTNKLGDFRVEYD